MSKPALASIPGHFMFPFFCGMLAFPPGASADALHGRVVDRASLTESTGGFGVPGARLELYNSQGKKIASKTSSKTGGFRFPKLASGTYTLTAEHAGYLPAKTARVFSVEPDDEDKDVYLDKMPMRQGVPARSLGKKKNADPDYYPTLAEAMLRSGHPALYRENVEGRACLSRFFETEEDTSAAYRSLWTALLWAEIDGQERPVESVVYLAHALDTTLKALGWPELAALKPYLAANPDSVESLSRTMRAMILASSKKISPADIPKFKVPKSLVLAMAEEKLRSKSLPMPKRKAFAAALRKLYGAGAAQRLAEVLSPPKKNKPRGADEKDAAAAAASDRLWQVVALQASAKRPNPVALFHIARRRFEDGHPREAFASLIRVLEMRPDYAPAWWIRSQCRLALGDSGAALADLDSLKRSESPAWQARAYQSLGELHWRAGRSAEAEQALWHAMGLDAKSDAARRSLYLLAEVSLASDTGSAVAKLLDSLAAQRPREPEAQYWLGRLALKRGNKKVALERFRKAMALDPKRVPFIEAMAKTHSLQEQCGAALRLLNPVRARLNSEGEAVYGECLIATGRSREAVSEFERRYAAKPSAQGLALWAKALILSGDPEQAARKIQEAREAGDPLARRALAEAKLALGSASDARRILEPMAAERPGDPDLILGLGRCALLERDYGRASQLFSQALQARSDFPEAFYQQGMCLLKLGRSGEAHTYFKELIPREEKSWQAKGFLGLGMAFYQENDSEEADKNLRRAFQLIPSAEAAAHLAMLALRSGKPDEAAAWARKSVKFDPGNYLTVMARVDVLLARHEDGDAVFLADSALDRHRESCDFLVVAAKAHLRADDDSTARVLSARAHDRCPTEPAPFYYLGSVSARAGAADEAKRHFESYVRAGGDIRRVPEAYR